MRDLGCSGDDITEDVALIDMPAESAVLPKTNLSSLIGAMIESNNFFFSVELIPAVTSRLRDLLNESLQALSQTRPLFASVIWNPKYLKITRDKSSGAICEVHHPAFDVVKLVQNKYGIPVIMHFSVGLLSAAEVHAVLIAAKAVGVQNILALRGDRDSQGNGEDFPFASELVKYIRREFGNYFTVAVAGYPLGHPEASSYEDDLQRLKEKVDNGADIIFTQMVLTSTEINHFVQDCRNTKICVPIIPGLHVFEVTKYSLQKMIHLCGIPDSHEVLTKMDDLQSNEEMEKKIGMETIGSIVKSLHLSRCCPGVHFFTLNRAQPVLELYNQCLTEQAHNSCNA